MKKLKYLFILLVMVLIPFNVFAESEVENPPEGLPPVASDECIPLYNYFILEDLKGNRIDNANIKLRSSDDLYKGNAEYIENGIYQISISDILDFYDELPTTKSSTIYIKNNSKILGVYSSNGTYIKYNKSADYSSVNNFILSTSNLSEDEFRNTYIFKNINDEYVTNRSNVCKLKYDESTLPILTYDVVVENTNHTGSVYIKSSELIDVSDDTEELSEPTISDLKINYDLKFNNLNDYAKYLIVIKNESDKEYEINHDDFKLNDYITYTFESDDDYILSPNSEKIVYVTVKYTNKIPSNKFKDGKYIDDNEMSINIKTKEEIKENPKTGIKNIIILVIIISIIGLVLFITIKNKSYFKTINIILISLILIPFTVKAIESLKLDIVTHIEVNNIREFCVEKIPPEQERPTRPPREESSQAKPNIKRIITSGRILTENLEYYDGETFGDYLKRTNSYSKFNLKSNVEYATSFKDACGKNEIVSFEQDGEVYYNLDSKIQNKESNICYRIRYIECETKS